MAKIKTNLNLISGKASIDGKFIESSLKISGKLPADRNNSESGEATIAQEKQTQRYDEISNSIDLSEFCSCWQVLKFINQKERE